MRVALEQLYIVLRSHKPESFICTTIVAQTTRTDPYYPWTYGTRGSKRFFTPKNAGYVPLLESYRVPISYLSPKIVLCRILRVVQLTDQSPQRFLLRFEPSPNPVSASFSRITRLVGPKWLPNANSVRKIANLGKWRDFNPLEHVFGDHSPDA